MLQCVERLDLIGMDFIWRIAMESPDEDIANEAIQLIITYSYINLNPKMKKVSMRTHTLHHPFPFSVSLSLTQIHNVLCSSPQYRIQCPYIRSL